MFSIAIIDVIGLTYDGTTLSKRGLGGSESAVILISKELKKLGFSVTVFNNCIDKEASEGIYDGVEYKDLSRLHDLNDFKFDIVISSRTVVPFLPEKYWPEFSSLSPHIFKKIKEQAKLKIVWMHDTFCRGDHIIEELCTEKHIDELFTLSDFQTAYITNCDHGKKRNFEVLKNKVFLTRNGVVNYIPEVDISKKDKNLFVYNASVTKGMLPLVERMWERIKNQIPKAKLIIIGGFYRFRENAEPDEQEKKWRQLIQETKYKFLDVTFTGVIRQEEIANILSAASFMVYPGAFPETFGISSLESLYYNTPLVTTRFGALEETALEGACYLMDYAIEPNGLFPLINGNEQEEKFIQMLVNAYNNPYLHQQKMHYCNILKNFCGWDGVALQWKQHLYRKLNDYLPIMEYKKVREINSKIHQIFGRRFSNKEEWFEPKNPEQRIVVVSTLFNAENYIDKCILSVASQDYNNYCHIIINDCSTDNTEKVIDETLKKLPDCIREKFILLNRDKNQGAVYNQIMSFRDSFIKDDDIVMILDGDDWLVNEPDIFDFYNNLYQNDETEFSYGSCWSVVDNIPLISQPYPNHILERKAYREHKFNWGLPYTHLRTFRKRLINNVNDSVFLNDTGEWFRAGGDVATFYNIIEQADPKKVKCVSRIVYNYNDANPLNDYKVNSNEQTKNALLAYKNNQKISFITPTMWRCKELFKKSLEQLVEHNLVGEIIIIDNDVKNRPTDWEVLNHFKVMLLTQEKNIKVNPAWNLGVEKSKFDIICLQNDDIIFDINLLNKIISKITPDIGVYGLITGEEHFGHPPTTDGSIDFIQWKPGNHVHGFGQLMFLHKTNWVPIIDGLEIYFGDDFIFHSQLIKGKNNYMIYNTNFTSPMAATTSDKDLTSGALERERPIFEKWLNHSPLSELDANYILQKEFTDSCNEMSDIYLHLPKLKELANKCETVVELGVRTGKSTRAFLSSSCKNLYSYDLYLDSKVIELFDIAKKVKNCSYEIADSTSMAIPETDMLFIDTEHTYEQLKRELVLHHNKVKKYIAFHDTYTYGLSSNNEAYRGILTSIIEFMMENPEWKFKYHTSLSNGLTVIEKTDASFSRTNDIRKKKKILIATPLSKFIETETFKSIYDLEIPDGYEADFQYFYGYQIDQVRNLIASWAVNYDYLFSIDSDIIVPNNALKLMLEHDKDMVSGLYIQRHVGLHLLEMYKDDNRISYEQIKDSGLIEIDWCGFGCLLIKSDVIRNMEYPQFVYKSALDHAHTLPEDRYFCIKAKEKGFKLYADTSILCGHIGSYTHKVN